MDFGVDHPWAHIVPLNQEAAMNFPIVPEDISALTPVELQALVDAFAAASKALATQEITPEMAATVRQARADYERVTARQAELAAEQAEFQADADFLASLAAETDEADTEDEAEDSAGGDDDEDAETETTDDDEDADAEDKVEVTASGKHLTAVRPKTFGSGRTTKPAPKAQLGTADRIVSTGEGGIVERGEQFENWNQLAQAAMVAAAELTPGATRRATVGRIVGEYDEAHTLTEDPLWNLRLFEDEAITAAMCAPATPYYNIGCTQTDRRPVFNSLPRFAAPRGAVSIYPSPTLESITGGYGIWTRTDDANPAAVKEACQTIDCADPTTYYLYGVYRCLTVKNLLAMTFPELVEAYLNRLAAAWARMAENQILNTIGAATTGVLAQDLGYGGSTSIVTTILTLIALHQESQRWDVAGNMEAWLPRWVMSAMKADLYRQRRTDGGARRLVSDAEINALFRDAGVNVNWFIDTPTWAATVPAVQTGGMLNFFPATVNMVIAPAGKFALMDRGELRIGVTGNNIYRDNVSNSKNEFTFFFESFEGVVDTDSCPAYSLEIPACWNGVQIADVALECDGTLTGT